MLADFDYPFPSSHLSGAASSASVRCSLPIAGATGTHRRAGTAGVLCLIGALAALLVSVRLDDVHAANRLECPSSDVDLALRSCTAVIFRRGAAPAQVATAFTGRCIAFWQKGAYQKAATDCAEAVRLGADTAIAHLIRGIALEDHSDHRAALAALTRALELEPTPAAHYDRAAVFLALGDYRRAIEDLDQAVAEGERNPQAYMNRAVARLALGDAAAALGDVERAGVLLPDDATAHAIRARVLSALGREAGERAHAAELPAVAGPAEALLFYPPSKVLPDALIERSKELPPLDFGVGEAAPKAASPEPDIAPRPVLGEAAPEAAAPKPEIAPRPVLVPAPRTRRARIRPLAERIADCMALWSADTFIPKPRWKETCQRFESELERPAGVHAKARGR
jgi:tetratricopeptide (TPR) repeat protein